VNAKEAINTTAINEVSFFILLIFNLIIVILCQFTYFLYILKIIISFL